MRQFLSDLLTLIHHLSFQFEFFLKHVATLTMVVGNRIFVAFTLITVAIALDPTPSERAKWDAVCMESKIKIHCSLVAWSRENPRRLTVKQRLDSNIE